MRTEMKTLSGDFSSLALFDDAAAKWHERRVRSFLAAMRRRAWVIVLFACVGLGGAGAWLTFAKPQYTSTALVQVDTRNKFSNFDNGLASPREGDPDAIRTEVEVLRSDAVVERVVNALDLTNDPEFSASGKPLLTKLVDLLPPELKNVLNSAGISLDRRDAASGSRGIDTATGNGATHNSESTNELGRPWQSSRSSVRRPSLRPPHRRRARRPRRNDHRARPGTSRSRTPRARRWRVPSPRRHAGTHGR